MKNISRLMLLGALALFSAQASAAALTLFEYAFNIDGTVTSNAAPAGVSIAGFDTSTGLGTVQVTLTGAGSHYAGLFVDHEIDEAINTFFNEFGAENGTPAAGQSWESDEPGFVFGDIFANFSASGLDNSNGVPASAPDDVSMALAWNFLLAADEQAVISFLVSTTAPASGFFLTQTDPDSDASIFFSSRLTITSGLPEPGVLLLLGAGLLALIFSRRGRGAP